MPKSNRKSARRSVRRKAPAASGSGPAPGSTNYTGPLIPRGLVGAQQMILRRFTYSSAASSNSSGVLIGAATSQPNGSVDWSAAAVLYQEYRTIGYRVGFHPVYLNYQSALATAPKLQAPIGFGINRNLASAPATLAGILQLERGQIRNTTERWYLSVRASGAVEMQFLSTAATSVTSQVNWVAVGLDTVTTYAIVTIEWLVQLRSPC